MMALERERQLRELAETLLDTINEYAYDGDPFEAYPAKSVLKETKELRDALGIGDRL
jgi:hypothetical protein